MKNRLEELYWTIVPYNYRPSQLWYKLKCCLFRKHNTVRCRYLPYTWTDRDAILAHVMFEVLSEFIERECDTSRPIENQDDHCKLIHLYDWWHLEYNKERINNIEQLEKEAQQCTPIIDSDAGPLSEMFSFKSEEDEQQWHEIHKKLTCIDQYYEKELNDKLYELLSLRKHLWI